MGEWQPIATMPDRRAVLVETATGLERVARTTPGWRVEHGRRHCYRADGRSADLMAVRWRELEPGELERHRAAVTKDHRND